MVRSHNFSNLASCLQFFEEIINYFTKILSEKSSRKLTGSELEYLLNVIHYMHQIFEDLFTIKNLLGNLPRTTMLAVVNTMGVKYIDLLGILEKRSSPEAIFIYNIYGYKILYLMSQDVEDSMQVCPLKVLSDSLNNLNLSVSLVANQNIAKIFLKFINELSSYPKRKNLTHVCQFNEGLQRLLSSLPINQRSELMSIFNREIEPKITLLSFFWRNSVTNENRAGKQNIQTNFSRSTPTL